MAILIDRYCLQRLVDIIEGSVILSDEERDNVISQLKRKIQVERDVESGRLCGRPKKVKEIVDIDF